MLEINACRRLIDLLSALSRGVHKLFLDVFLADAQSLHFLSELSLLLFPDWKIDHECTLPTFQKQINSQIINEKEARAKIFYL